MDGLLINKPSNHMNLGIAVLDRNRPVLKEGDLNSSLTRG